MGWVTRNVPAPVVRVVRSMMRSVTREPQVGSIDFGVLRRTRPIARDFGAGRGGQVDRHYIESFLDAHREDVRGRVLEIGDDAYTRRFGDGRVQHTDILNVAAGDRRTTIVADLADAPHLGDDSFDCIILTQTLQYIFRPELAVATLHRVLRPGGVLLLTVPGLTQVATRHKWGPSWYWSFTAQSVRLLLAERFGAQRVQCQTFGNVLTAAAHLYGISAAELSPAEVAVTDPDYQLIIAARVVKDGADTHRAAPERGA
jgi:SAM-dependent methyltransferase